MINDTIMTNYSVMRDGTFSPTGFKHLLVVIVAASICLPDKTIVLTNVPNILETQTLVSIIKQLNGEAIFEANKLTVNTSGINSTDISENLSKKIHGAIYLIPTLLARFGQIKFGKFGGCELSDETPVGKRPINHMIDIFEKFGCEIENNNGQLMVYANKIKATSLDIMAFSDSQKILTGPLVSGATKTAILMALSIKSGRVVILNPYMKPDVTELLKFLIKAGFDIDFDHKSIVISKKLMQFKQIIKFHLISDLCQIMTYITCALYFNIKVKIQDLDTNKVLHGLDAEFKLLKQMGVKIVSDKNSILITNNQSIKPFMLEVTSMGIYSDNQPFFALLATKAQGSSYIEEQVWKNRFLFANELIKLGFDLKVVDNSLTINPSACLNKNTTLQATDLRAAAVLLIAALNNKGQTIIKNMSHLERGYDALVENLKSIGANIK